MDVSAAVQLIGSGNLKDVEQRWIGFVAEKDRSAADVIQMLPVLEALASSNKLDEAGALAWTAVEALAENKDPAEALEASRKFLLFLNKNADLKKITADLYRKVHSDVEGLDPLLEEAGVGGGRPPRRALRTMDVCLNLKPGMYASARREERAVLVESIDRANWEITFNTGDDSQTLGPVEFADTYQPCSEDDYRVLAAFDRKKLAGKLDKDPATIIENVLIAKGGYLDSDELQELLTPAIIPNSDWTKWWTKARTALRKSTHIKIGGRSPYDLEYVPGGEDIQTKFVLQFKMLDTAGERLVAVEALVRECSVRSEAPKADLLAPIREVLSNRAQRIEGRNPAGALAERFVDAELARALGEDNADSAVDKVMSKLENPAEVLANTCENSSLWRGVCRRLPIARPGDWSQVLAEIFAYAPANVCDELANMIDKCEAPAPSPTRIVTSMTNDSLASFHALCWVWQKGLDRKGWQEVPAITILTRMLGVLGDVQRDDKIPSHTTKSVCTAARAAFSAGKYKRLKACLTEIETGVAVALRTQIQRLENLGRKVSDDMLSRINEQFPSLHLRKEEPPWARENIVFATREGISKLDSEIKELVNVKMRENARAIGAAAEKGDLSENSEYKFALEERDLLRARLAQMHEQMAKAQPIDPDGVPDDHVGIGSRVTFKNSKTGEQIEMTFLGPFDADVDHGIYNYKAPFSQDLMSSRVGRKIELPMLDDPGPYEIVGLGSWKKLGE